MLSTQSTSWLSCNAILAVLLWGVFRHIPPATLGAQWQKSIKTGLYTWSNYRSSAKLLLAGHVTSHGLLVSQRMSFPDIRDQQLMVAAQKHAASLQADEFALGIPARCVWEHPIVQLLGCQARLYPATAKRLKWTMNLLVISCNFL